MIEAVLSAARPNVDAMTIGKLRFAHLKIMENFRLTLPDAADDAGNPEYAFDDAFVIHPGTSRVRWKASAVPLAVIALLALGGGYKLYTLAHAPYPVGIDTLLALALGIVIAISVTARFLRVAKRLHVSFVYTNTFDHPVEPDEHRIAEKGKTIARFGIVKPDGFEVLIRTTWHAAQRIEKECRLNKEAREGLNAAAPGKLGNLANADGALAYNPRHIAFVRLRRLNVWRAVGGLLLVLGGVFAVLATIAVVNELWGDDLGALWFWFIGVPALGIWAWLCFGGMLWALSVVIRWCSGTPFSELGGLRMTYPYRVEVRGMRGRWTTIAEYRHRAVAIEVYNLIVRDLHQRAE